MPTTNLMTFRTNHLTESAVGRVGFLRKMVALHTTEYIERSVKLGVNREYMMANLNDYIAELTSMKPAPKYTPTAADLAEMAREEARMGRLYRAARRSGSDF